VALCIRPLHSTQKPLLLSVPFALFVESGEHSNFERTTRPSQTSLCLAFNEAGTLACSNCSFTIRERRIIRDPTTWAATWVEAFKLRYPMRRRYPRLTQLGYGAPRGNGRPVGRVGTRSKCRKSRSFEACWM
jgi:hypothetical protein